MNLEPFRNGISGNLEDWLAFNRDGAFASTGGLALAAPFPPTELMQNVSGLTKPRDFAAHGCDILEAVSAASPTPLNAFTDILDFGVGVGRLARMFKGFQGRYTGIDVDTRHVAWVSSALDYVTAIATEPKQPLPLAEGSFDCMLSISVFTHMNERDHLFYLEQLARVARPGEPVSHRARRTRAAACGDRSIDSRDAGGAAASDRRHPPSVSRAGIQLHPPAGASHVEPLRLPHHVHLSRLCRARME